MADFIDYYSLLGIAPDASPGEIRDAFRSAAQAWHSDRWSGASEQRRAHAEEMMKRVNAAREVLRDPGRRAEYDSRLRRSGAARTAAGTSRPGTPRAGNRDRIVLACPQCDAEHPLANPKGKWIRLRCTRCASVFVALAGAVCMTSMHRAAGDGTQQFVVRAQLAAEAEELVTFACSPIASLRLRDSFSIVYADNLPAAVYNHTQGAIWLLAREKPAREGSGEELLGFVAGLACWLLSFLFVRPSIGDLSYFAAVAVATFALAHFRRAAILPWLAAAVLTAGAATFILAVRGAPRSRPLGGRL